ncbi:MAG: hypothetical protein J4N96_05320 [Chloroflexi bacterium]|nr:hypothetical protein [Chloroflexota bacterium]MCI0803847.1 hypothetical protein [Chloroflexota bacterium]
MAEENLEEKAKNKGLRGTLGSARDAVGSSIDKVSGAEFRRQFEQFTNVVQTTVVGVHRDQLGLDKRLEKLEQFTNAVETTIAGIQRDQVQLNKRLEKLERPTPATPATHPDQKLVVAALVFSVIAVFVAIWALVSP